MVITISPIDYHGKIKYLLRLFTTITLKWVKSVTTTKENFQLCLTLTPNYADIPIIFLLIFEFSLSDLKGYFWLFYDQTPIM